MNPDNIQPAPEMNPDYLNQIAPKPQKKSLLPESKPIKIGIIAVGFLVIITIVGMLASAAGSNIGDSERLAARLQSTQSIILSSKPNVKNSQLRTLNTNLITYLANTQVDLTPILLKHNVKMNSLSKTVTSAESDTTILATLEDARLNATYDRIYASEMAHQLDITIILMQKIYKSTSDANLKSVLDTAYKSLQPIQKQFENFNEND